MESIINQVKETHPLVHNITNYVTVNDVANAILAVKASPIMADDAQEVEEITSITQALNINIGTLNSRSIESMFIAGRKAKELNHPIIIDCVGVGASKLRTDTAKQLIDDIHPTVIKGNISEIKTIMGLDAFTQGVDANESDELNSKNIDNLLAQIKAYALKHQCIVCITGKIDIICNDKECYLVKNGSAKMSLVTGTGCMLSGIIAAYIASSDNILEATTCAVMHMGIAGEIAQEKLRFDEGNSSYRNRIIDQLYLMNEEILRERGKYERR